MYTWPLTERILIIRRDKKKKKKKRKKSLYTVCASRVPRRVVFVHYSDRVCNNDDRVLGDFRLVTQRESLTESSDITMLLVSYLCYSRAILL